MPRPTASSAWQALQSHRQQLSASTLADLFAANPERASQFSLEAAGLFLDYSRQPVRAETLTLLQQLLNDAGFNTARDALFSGAKINTTEQRAAWHTALRAGDKAPAEVQAELARMADFVDKLRAGVWQGFSGQAITDVVNLGVGGSDLGPRMVCHALHGEADGPRLHFVANADGAELASTLRGLNPATTLFIVASKSFTTAETRANAEAALGWLETAGAAGALAKHCVVVSANPDAASSLGLPKENAFTIWDWVGGRYSLWSAMGLSVALVVGMDGFRALLAGGAAMDKHFAEAEPSRNMPVIQALLGIWQRNFLGVGQQIVLPYTHYLEYLPAYLQQLDMESNGKRIDQDGRVVDYATGCSIWGQAGTNAQHAFMQWVQQSTAKLPVDFILPLTVPGQTRAQQRFQVASCLAQAATLMHGYTPEAADAGIAAHRLLPGNRPSSMLVLPSLDAYHLGAMLALYEHRVFVQAVVWHINPFDQWGVEHAKRMASGLQATLDGGETT
ncbi:MAG: glucose-6-phosphate isomerase, partial [Nevskiales bacterium]